MVTTTNTKRPGIPIATNPSVDPPNPVNNTIPNTNPFQDNTHHEVPIQTTESVGDCLQFVQNRIKKSLVSLTRFVKPIIATTTQTVLVKLTLPVSEPKVKTPKGSRIKTVITPVVTKALKQPMNTQRRRYNKIKASVKTPIRSKGSFISTISSYFLGNNW